ncbi:MAG: HAMP domain-containing sensor histidine kinase [Paracoccaceae bacterium]|nr:HAMP domain-containing sensor histidine kinase [Paracoccaceae bacterium]
MDHASVTSGAAFKTAVRATAVLLLVLALASVTAYFYLQHKMLTNLEDQISEDQLVLAQIYPEGGPAGLAMAINQLRHPLAVKQRVVGLFTADGTRVAGNIDSAPDAQGWSRQPFRFKVFTSAQDISETANFYLHKANIDQFSLVVGRSLSEMERQQGLMIAAFVSLALLMSAAFLLLGFGASLQSLRKLDRMAIVLDRVSQGDTGARLVVSAQNDQIDRVSRAMNLHLNRLTMLMQTTKASAAAIAHDLRTPLSRVFLLMDRVQTELDKGGDPRALIDEVETELRRLNNVFDAIMRISRLEAAQGGLDFSIAPLAPLLADLAETFAPVAEENGQSLILPPVAADVAVRGDAAMLAQMLANLIQNAITHCPAGTVISLGAAADAKGTRLWVSDTGPGIPEAERDKVFDLFYRIDANRTGDGNGLGMALVKAIAERLGGRISLLDATPGLRVEIIFPPLSQT